MGQLTTFALWRAYVLMLLFSQLLQFNSEASSALLLLPGNYEEIASKTSSQVAGYGCPFRLRLYLRSLYLLAEGPRRMQEVGDEPDVSQEEPTLNQVTENTNSQVSENQEEINIEGTENTDIQNEDIEEEALQVDPSNEDAEGVVDEGVEGEEDFQVSDAGGALQIDDTVIGETHEENEQLQHDEPIETEECQEMNETEEVSQEEPVIFEHMTEEHKELVIDEDPQVSQDIQENGDHCKGEVALSIQEQSSENGPDLECDNNEDQNDMEGDVMKEVNETGETEVSNIDGTSSQDLSVDQRDNYNVVNGTGNEQVENLDVENEKEEHNEDGSQKNEETLETKEFGDDPEAGEGVEHDPDGMDVDGSNHVESVGDEAVNGDIMDDSGSGETLKISTMPSEFKSLPQCRLKRNYSCLHCGFNTQNPREHLYHLRDEHGERMKVFECPRCIYASKNQQKLIRHARMVHKLKIKTKESSTSPYKKRSKSPRAKVSPSKSSRGSVSPGKSSRSSPGKSPRSYEGTDGWDEEEDEDDYLDDDESSIKDGEKGSFSCVQCDYTCRSRKLLNRHETTFHLKRRFFRCVKCNYVTHLKGRYTKHMKYHQLPILKCEYCDFRTPYRWNLDRHMKNHTEDCGEYKCHLCNFTAQIKQSLTVHISNHHLTPEQIREREMKRTIGISDPADCTSDDQEMEMMRLERDEHPDALRLPGIDYPDSPFGQDSHHNGNSFRVSNIDMGGTEDSQINADDSKDEDGEPKPKKPKIKITLKKMKEPKQQKDTFFQELNERHNFEEDFIHPDDVVHRHGNVYIKTFKCRVCSYKAAFKNEVSRHEKKIHSIPMPKSETHSKKNKKSPKSSRSPKERPDTLQQILQYPQSFTINEDYEPKMRRESTERASPVERREFDLREKTSTKYHNNNNNNNSEQGSSNSRSADDSCDSQAASSKESSPSKDVKKKNSSSFFDKLQEKISTSNVQNLVCQFCGHESKCLSESVRHQKLHLSAKNIYASASLSTRCQFCRHRCKTTDDLVNHLKLCPEARKNQIMDSGKRVSGGRHDENDDDDDSYQDDYPEEAPENEESMNDDSKDGEVQDAFEDDKHPMENRVFVWNKFRSQEKGEQEVDEIKHKMEVEEDSDDDRDSKSDILDTPSKESSKSPVMMDYQLDYIESPTPQGNHYYSKRVFRCPQCSFWATTASRFHVHIVGHFNKKPYNCSECGYKSNWRWDITKHIKLKTTRDNSHQKADVVITDATGEKNYEKYDRYLTVIQLDETNAHRTEGGIPNRKGRPKRTPEKDEEPESDTPTTSPVRKPPMVTIPVMPRFQAMPRLTRAPAPTTTRPGPMPFGPILPGPQMMVQLAGSGSANTSNNAARPPPPLSLRGSNPTKTPTTTTTTTTTTATSLSSSGKVNSVEESATSTPATTAQYQIITPQVSVSSTGEDGREVAKMVLDHEGNPEWKCNTCDFRDSERETVVQHVRLAHARGGPVSLLHAVHRCDVCGYAAGTKRAVQLHIDSSHSGQGGITSRCEGQTPNPKDSSGDGEHDHHESPRMMKCRICPFSCKKRSEMRAHIVYHTSRPDCIFKCMFCPYYVPTKLELFEHLSLHGMEVPASVLEAVSRNNGSSTVSQAPNQQDDGSRQFLCGACPFETRSRSKLMHHRQFHKPKGLPFKCPHCTYNVTRRHLLSQHIRVHGVDPGPDDGLENNDSAIDDRSNSPSPSLTITPVTSVAAVGERGQDSTFTDASALPKLTDQTTMLLEDIPLVWVSRDNRFFKMFKCRHCPHVNLRKTNIQEHEKMHKPDAARESGGLHCPHCSYISVNAGVMSAHLKVHGGSMGQCHAIVDPALSDEDQLRLLTSKATPSPVSSLPSNSPVKEENAANKLDEKLLYFCQLCPARFFFEKEIQIHSRFHLSSLPYHCEHCNFGGRQEAHLLTHAKVHSPEYQQRTRTMLSQHRASTSHPPVRGLSLPIGTVTENIAVPTQDTREGNRKRPYVGSPPPSASGMPQPPPTSKYMCDQCPASFSKLLTLQYHQSLHGANNPYSCQRCSYAGKTADNLKQHQQLHEQHDDDVKTGSTSKETEAKEALAGVETANAAAAAAAAAAAVTAGVTANSRLISPGKAEKYRVENSSKPHKHSKHDKDSSSHHPPIKLKLIGLRPISSENNSGGRPQFKYYVEEQVPLSGVDLLRRKTEMEREGQQKGVSESTFSGKSSSKNKSSKEKEESEVENDPMRIGDRNLHYPLHIDKVTGKSREKRYKCNKCPSAFEKTEQYHVHTNLHGSNHKYRCQICDYSVKFYANFMMHINRHKYHEKMVAQKSGTPLPSDEDPKFLPAIANAGSSNDNKASKNKYEDKENFDDRDLTTTERQHLLLQNKKGVDNSKKDADKERQVYYCIYCPYANIRRDAVDSHSYRHLANGGYGVYKCTLCDYTASQLNFIKEHTKVHFRPFKYVNPEGFMRHDRHEILSTPVIVPGTKQSDGQKSGEANNQPSQEKYLVFSHDSGVFKPSNPGDNMADSDLVSGIKVNYRSGDVVDAPNDFVISLRPTKSKSVHKVSEVSVTMASSEAASNKTYADESAASHSVIESTKLPETEELNEDEASKCLIKTGVMDQPSSNSLGQEEVNLTNGHAASDEKEALLSGVSNDPMADDVETVGNGVALTSEEEKMEIDNETQESLPKISITKRWGPEQKPETLVSSH
ncbi:zinc finger protein 142-like isoform X4 [Macrobrachium rosenbergii]|uniref:zinc finger protein 142-like isoform X4 n=1 Tax=Macrobrachium rosenbergii TaxID=79674 RepID=UPI0034D45B69